VRVLATAVFDARDLRANRERYERESNAKLPAAQKWQPPKPLRRFFAWYYTRIYVHVRPERIYVWPGADLEAEPTLYDAHLEEVRSGHNEEPEEGHAQPEGGAPLWNPRLDELGREYGSGVLGFVGPDGFPFAVRVPVRADRAAGVVRIEADPVGAPLDAGLACLVAHAHAPDFTWQRNFQVRGDLAEHDEGWALRPHRLVGGMEMPASAVERYRGSLRKMRRYRATARREQARRAG